MYFSNDEDNSVNFFVENARGNNGEYKINDIDDQCVDYYVCINMVEDIVFDKLVGENATWNWVQVDMEDFEECCGYDEREEVVCEECEECEISCEQCRDIGIIEEYADKIENADHICSGCLRNILYELLLIGKNLGWDDCEEHVRDFVDEMFEN